MRQIKFRVWDKKENKFIGINPFPKDGWIMNEFKLDRLEGDVRILTGVSGKNMFLTIDGKFVSVCPVNDLNTCAVEDTERYVVQQFTGLLDSEKKEIYEGDFISMPSEKIGPVEWENDWARWAYRNEEGRLIGFCMAYGLLIVGNIFENPELFK